MDYVVRTSELCTRLSSEFHRRPSPSGLGSIKAYPLMPDTSFSLSRGIGQSFTSYHHRLTLAPTEEPPSRAFLFQNCHPHMTRLYRTPCAKGMITFIVAA